MVRISSAILAVFACSVTALKVKDPVKLKNSEVESAISESESDMSTWSAEMIYSYFKVDEFSMTLAELGTLDGSGRPVLSTASHCCPISRKKGYAGRDWKDMVRYKGESIQELKNPAILLYGDSMIEHLQGEDGARRIGQSQVRIWQKFTERYAEIGPSHASGINGDNVPNLLWRIHNGEGPEMVDGEAPKVIMLRIGDNDLSWVSGDDEGGAEQIFEGYKNLVKDLRQASPSSKILLTDIHPHGPRWGHVSREPEGTWANGRETVCTKCFPGHIIIPSLSQKIKSLAKDEENNIYYAECGHVLLKKDGTIDEGLQWREHPTDEGLRRWLHCLEPTLDKLLLK